MNEGLFFRRADGAEIPVKEVEGLKGDGLLILMTETFLREEDMQKMQQSIERRIGDGTRVLVLDAQIKRLCGWRCERGIYMHTSGKGKEKRL